MSLVLELAYHVPSLLRQRGATVYRRGAVLGATSGEDWLRTRVQGGSRRPHRVELRRENDDLRASCDCATFSAQGICEHVWATLLWAEATGLDEPLTSSDTSSGGTSRTPRLLSDVDDAEQRREDLDEVDEVLVVDEDEAAAADLADRELLAAHPERWLREPRKPRLGRRGVWQDRIEAAHYATPRATADIWGDVDEQLRLLYLIGPEASRHGLRIELVEARRRRDGTFGRHATARVRPGDLDRDRRVDAIDRRLLGLLLAQRGMSTWHEEPLVFDVHPSSLDMLLPLLCSSGRLFLDEGPTTKGAALILDEGEPWSLHLEVGHEARDARETPLVLDGALVRGEERLSADDTFILLGEGWFIHRGQVRRYGERDVAFRWLRLLRAGGALTLPVEEIDDLIERLYHVGAPAHVRWPEGLAPTIDHPDPRPCLDVLSPPADAAEERRRAQPLALHFDYDGHRVAADDPRPAVVIPSARRVLQRDPRAEETAIERLRALGARPAAIAAGVPGVGLEIATSSLDESLLQLVAEGWRVESDGARLRSAGRVNLAVEGSGIDWFELRGSVAFDDLEATLPAILAALEGGKRTVRLDDGSQGVLPEAWLARYGLLLAAGEIAGDHLRFRPKQIGLLDALLADREGDANAAFTAARERLVQFHSSPKPARTPRGFKGTLRPYQREGLGWLRYLQDLGLGGCLADDMGLGKTIQALALLLHDKHTRKRKKRQHKPALVVVPRSLLTNWKTEAERFTPELSVLLHQGPKRTRDPEVLNPVDLVVTTYGTLRRDIIWLKDIDFGIVILDEAQAIKNAATESSKAARLLRGELRLALSGTPVENRLTELWSLYAFLEPGLLGENSSFTRVAQRLRGGEAAVEELARILRPLLLRRTKDQVASDLPPRVEQVLRCELEGEARVFYDNLRDHYRQALLESRTGVGSRVKILEGLLRLRQAACHPGLVDKEHAEKHQSAKLDLLEDRLESATGEGHKALVFSQFTEFLGLLRKRLDARGVVYAYLDGKTRRRGEAVERFQTDPECRLFLISLKAGGFGLNLTAADYVFLLDPWWNPAVEAQAIDRTHRIGQTRPVMAYRLIAQDTVEEKVLELQERKAALAEAIFSGAANVLSELTRDDLEILLS